jgi:putative ABC transport system permease protein
MQLVETTKLALGSFLAHKMRTILTLLGVVIGVASVITVVTLTTGAQKYVAAQVNKYGASVITISKQPQTSITFAEFLSFQKRRNITFEDYKAIDSDCKSCESVGATRSTTGKIVYGTKSTSNTEVRGWTWTMPEIANLNIEYGRSFTDDEDKHSAHVVVVGYDIVENILGPGDPLGKEIRIDGYPYTVIGVGEPQGEILGVSMDNWVYVPLTAFCRSYGSDASLDIYVNASEGGEVIDAVSDELRVIMRSRRHLSPDASDTFSIDTSATYEDMLGSIVTNFGAVVATMAGISLIVGGVAMMNIMLVSVSERTREIGIRKALGASSRDILIQFMIESVAMSIAGGVIGIAVGIGVAKVVTISIGFPSAVQLWSILISLFISTCIGLFFGVYPAFKAAQLDPIAAMTSEL